MEGTILLKSIGVIFFSGKNSLIVLVTMSANVFGSNIVNLHFDILPKGCPFWLTHKPLLFLFGFIKGRI
jgi:hypothetical protein